MAYDHGGLAKVCCCCLTCRGNDPDRVQPGIPARPLCKRCAGRVYYWISLAPDFAFGHEPAGKIWHGQEGGGHHVQRIFAENKNKLNLKSSNCSYNDTRKGFIKHWCPGSFSSTRASFFLVQDRTPQNFSESVS